MTKATLIECDEACMAMIERLDRDSIARGRGAYVIERIDKEYCFVVADEDKVAVLKHKVKEFMDHAVGKNEEVEDTDSDLESKHE